MHLTSIDDAAWTSPWRRRAVGDKALLSLGLVLTAVCLPPVPCGVLVGIAAVAALLGPARVPARAVAQAMGPPMAVILLGVLPVVVAIGSPAPGAWATWGPLWISAASARPALDLFVHGVAGTLAVLVLAMTTPMVDLLASARPLRIPDACLDIASLMYRLLFVLMDTALTIASAQRGRLGDSPAPRRSPPRRSRLRGRFETAGTLTTTTMVRSWDRARRLTDGLSGRGYETALVTLPPHRPRSVPFEVAAVALILAVWAVGVTR